MEHPSVPALTLIQCVEAFHLAFLRILESKLDRSLFVVKGGVNLRAWFGSARYSEDLDLDVLRGEPFELRDKVDAVVASPALQNLLRSQRLAIVKSSKPKQTGTTQRWKFELAAAGHTTPLNTKIEFSRRGAEEDYALESALPAIVRSYGIPAPTLNHYTAAAAMRQKIAALAGRREPQARDVWDLEHLFRTTRADPRPLPAATRGVLPTALNRVVEMSYAEFKGQVVPYLAPDEQDLHGSVEAWRHLQEHVVDRLLGLQE